MGEILNFLQKMPFSSPLIIQKLIEVVIIIWRLDQTWLKPGEWLRKNKDRTSMSENKT